MLRVRQINARNMWVTTLSLSSLVLLLLPLKSANPVKFYENSGTYSSSRSFKVTDLGVNRKRICNFLLVINSNYGQFLRY